MMVDFSVSQHQHLAQTNKQAPEVKGPPTTSATYAKGGKVKAPPFIKKGGKKK